MIHPPGWRVHVLSSAYANYFIRYTKTAEGTEWGTHPYVMINKEAYPFDLPPRVSTGSFLECVVHIRGHHIHYQSTSRFGTHLIESETAGWSQSHRIHQKETPA